MRTGKNRLVFVARIPGWRNPHGMPMARRLMLAEEYDLYAQGYLKYCGASAPGENGLTGTPRLLVSRKHKKL